MHRLPVVRHRTARQAWANYRACRQPAEKTHRHLIWLLLLRTDEPRTPAQAAEVVGVSVITARAVLHRWNDHGPAGLADRRAKNHGPSALTDAQRRDLFGALRKRPPDGGLWTGPKVARYADDRWGVSVAFQTGWRWLRELGFALQVPRPSHPKAASPVDRRRWKTQPADATGPPASGSPA